MFGPHGQTNVVEFSQIQDAITRHAQLAVQMGPANVDITRF